MDISFVSYRENNQPNDNESNTIKKIVVDLLPKRKNPLSMCKQSKSSISSTEPARDLAIVGTNCWTFNEKELESTELQYEYLDFIYKNIESTSPDIERKIKTIKTSIYTKRAGYKQQDIKKEIYNDDLFISFDQIIKLLIDSKLSCFYCQENVKLIYSKVCDNKQWSLERIYNQYGHNHNNVEIACLKCNIKRSTMHHERYVKTKQMVRVEKIDESYQTT